MVIRIGIIIVSIALALFAFPINSAKAVEFDWDTRQSTQIVVVTPIKTIEQKKLSTAKIKVAKVDKSVRTKFAPGYCTDYVAKKLPITWNGNANRWIVNAKAQGYNVDKSPVQGAILVTRESRWGHVSYIESVEGTRVTISEWNYAGRYVLTTRTLDITNPVITGVIHI